MATSKTRKVATMILSLMLLACLAVSLSVTAYAGNSSDEPFSFSFSGAKDNTYGRRKLDDTNVYMKVNTIGAAFTAHVVGMTGTSKYGTLVDCSRGYNYSVTGTGVWRMRNWVYDGYPRYDYAGIYAAPTYGYNYSASGLWSPDSV